MRNQSVFGVHADEDNRPRARLAAQEQENDTALHPLRTVPLSHVPRRIVQLVFLSYGVTMAASYGVAHRPAESFTRGVSGGTLFFLVIVAPLLIAWLTVRVAGQRAAALVARAVGLGGTLMILLWGAQRLMHLSAPSDPDPGLLGQGLFTLLATLPVCTGIAALGGWLKRRSFRRPRE